MPLIHIEYTDGVGVGGARLPAAEQYDSGPLLYESHTLPPLYPKQESALHVLCPVLFVDWLLVVEGVDPSVQVTLEVEDHTHSVSAGSWTTRLTERAALACRVMAMIGHRGR